MTREGSGGKAKREDQGWITRFGSRMKEHYVYILCSPSRTLYVGVTNDLVRRIAEHRQGHGSGFTSKYGIVRLVHFESTIDVRAAIAREKQIKGWRRSKKVALIEAMNPTWADLSAAS